MEQHIQPSERDVKERRPDSFLQLLLSRTTFWNPAGVIWLLVVLMGVLFSLAFLAWRQFF